MVVVMIAALVGERAVPALHRPEQLIVGLADFDIVFGAEPEPGHIGFRVDQEQDVDELNSLLLVQRQKENPPVLLDGFHFQYI